MWFYKDASSQIIQVGNVIEYQTDNGKVYIAPNTAKELQRIKNAFDEAFKTEVGVFFRIFEKIANTFELEIKNPYNGTYYDQEYTEKATLAKNF